LEVYSPVKNRANDPTVVKVEHAPDNTTVITVKICYDANRKLGVEGLNMNPTIVGTWRINKMEKWDSDFLDLMVKAYIKFERDGLGRFQCGAIQGFIDARFSDREGAPFVEFSWDGDDEGTDVCGRGVATLYPNDTLCGHIFFHQGEDAEFLATRIPDKSGQRRGARGHPR
jgi:hypothetical protein